MIGPVTKAAIINEAVEKAIYNGWKFKVFMFEYEYPNFEKTWTGNIIVATSKSGKAVTINYIELFFDHEFAKVLWGDRFADEYGPGYAWKFHLQQMIIANDPIKYLGDNI